jgi:hypothetical protein
MTVQQLLAQASSFNPEIGSIHVEHTVYEDGDEYLHYIAHVPGDQIFGDSPDDLLANVMALSRKAA